MSTNRKLFKYKRVAIDFDGTLVQSIVDGNTTDEYFNEAKDLEAQPGAADATKWLKDQGFEILIFTCRPDYHRRYMERILKKNNIVYDYILFYTKPLVDLYIDDKGFRFLDWNETKSWIESRLDSYVGEEAVNHIGMEPHSEFETFMRREKLIQTLRNKEDLVLDVGCGSGEVWKEAPEWIMPRRLIGIEIDPVLGKMATDSGFYEWVYDTPINVPGSTTIMYGLLEHLDSPDSPEDVLSRYRGANKIIVTVPNAWSFHRHFGYNNGNTKSLDELGEQDLAIGHKRVFDPLSLKKLLRDFCDEHSFRIFEMGSCGFKVSTSKEMEPFLDRWPALIKTAEEMGMVGKNRYHGAELYAIMDKVK